MKEEMVVIVDNRLWQSLGRDIATLGTFVSMIGLGVFLQSSAMQWVGGLIWFLWVIGRAAIVEKKCLILFDAITVKKLNELRCNSTMLSNM